MESSDDRAAARLIAERTLALADDEAEAPAPRSRRFVLLAAVSLVMVVVAMLGLVPWWTQPPAASARPETADPAAAAPTPDKDVGYLSCNAWPSATVYVDGRRLPGRTPLRSVPLPAGTHTVVLVSADGTLRKEVPVNILPGQTRTIAVSLEPTR